MKRRSLLGVCVLIAACSQAAASSECEAAGRVALAKDGKPLLGIVVSADASDSTRSTAAVLADYLGRMTGGKYKLQEGDGTSGIAVGRAEDFPSLKLNVDFDPTEATKREDYLLRSHSQGVWLVGASDLAVRNAVWDFLYRLGHRQFFPGAKWEIVPTRRHL